MTVTVQEVKTAVREIMEEQGKDFMPPTTGRYIMDDDPCCIVAQVFNNLNIAEVEQMYEWDMQMFNQVNQLVEHEEIEGLSEDAVDFLNNLQWAQDIGMDMENVFISAVSKHESKVPSVAA